MVALPQTHAVRKRPVKLPKSRAKQHGQEDVRSPSAEETEVSKQLNTDLMDSIENRNPFFQLLSKPPSSAITIEQYISQKSVRSSLAFLSSDQSQNDDIIHSSTIINIAVTSQAEDEAYSYLFQHLSGKCHGLNLIQHPATPNGYGNCESGSAFVRIVLVVYVEPGTMCHYWEDIERGLECIFKRAADKDVSEAKWQLAGVTFKVWSSN